MNCWKGLEEDSALVTYPPLSQVFAIHVYDLYNFLCNNSLKHLHFSYINLL